MINVAVTRAKRKFILVANINFWKNNLKENPQNALLQLISYIERTGDIIDIRENKLGNYLESLPRLEKAKYYPIRINKQGDSSKYSQLPDLNSNDKPLDERNELYKNLGQDISNAKKGMLMSITDGHLWSDAKSWILSREMDDELQEREKETLQLILDKVNDEDASRHVSIRCKSSVHGELPTALRKLPHISSNVEMPLLKMDNGKIWYGIPLSRGTYWDGDIGYLTACQIVYRISGKHTVELIDTFAEIGIDTYNKEGFKEYINKNMKCPHCKQPMMLEKSKNGAWYLKCSSRKCSKTMLLEDETVYRYLDKNHVLCPECNQELDVRLGPYGLFCRCGEGHTINLSAI